MSQLIRTFARSHATVYLASLYTNNCSPAIYLKPPICFDILASKSASIMSDKKVWFHDEIENVLSLYEENPVLWDMRSQIYRNRNKTFVKLFAQI